MMNWKLFLRNLLQNKLYFFVTVFGFAIALTFVILLGTYVRQELSVDQFHKNKDRIYRVAHEGGSMYGALTGQRLKENYPEIQSFTRLIQTNVDVENLQKEKINIHSLLVDSSFFNMFSFRLLEGEPSTLFQSENNIVLTRSFALKFFGREHVVGEEIVLAEDFRFKVTGVVEDMPDNTHFDQCDAFLHIDFLAIYWGSPDVLTTDSYSIFGLYVMVYPKSDIVSKVPVMLDYLKKNYSWYMEGYCKELYFEPLSDVYWGGKTGRGTHGNSWGLLVSLSAITIIILLLALINYNNLSIAQTTTRAKEVAIKKLVGTDNRAIFLQFLSESVLLCILAFLIAGLLVRMILPFFNTILETHISLSQLLTLENSLIACLGMIILGCIAGIIPAWLITRFKPVDVVKGVFRRKMKGEFGKVLICFQYLVAMVLLGITLIVLHQTWYLRNFDLGFDKENIIYFKGHIEASQKAALRNEFNRVSGVQQVSFMAGSPLDGGENNSFVYENKPVSFQVFRVDTAFFHLLDISVRSTGVKQGAWLNQRAVEELGLDDLPKVLNNVPFGESVPIAGITDNFHFQDLTHKVGSLIILPLQEEGEPWSVLVKINGQHSQMIYRELKEVYRRFNYDVPFDSGFMDQTMDSWYKQNDRIASLIGCFTLVAFVLAMMGILAMAMYYIQQRIKEIGLRRVNGAKITNILWMLVSGFMRWVLLAYILACPVIWWVTERWLSNFPYRISVSGWIFVVVGVFSGLLALLMVGGQSLRAAHLNPVKTLRSE